jgi:hypothetical protein
MTVEIGHFDSEVGLLEHGLYKDAFRFITPLNGNGRSRQSFSLVLAVSIFSVVLGGIIFQERATVILTDGGASDIQTCVFSK